MIQETTEESEVYVRTLADDPDDPRPDDPDDPGGYIRRRDAPFSTLEKSSHSIHIEAVKLLKAGNCWKTSGVLSRRARLQVRS